jgi:hypothetical protein
MGGEDWYQVPRTPQLGPIAPLLDPIPDLPEHTIALAHILTYVVVVGKIAFRVLEYMPCR